VVSSLSLVDEPTVVNSTMVEFQLAIGLVKNSLTLEMQPTHPCSAAAPEGSAAMQVVEDDNLIRRERLPQLVYANLNFPGFFHCIHWSGRFDPAIH
jgi:hypothetical protein